VKPNLHLNPVSPTRRLHVEHRHGCARDPPPLLPSSCERSESGATEDEGTETATATTTSTSKAAIGSTGDDDCDVVAVGGGCDGGARDWLRTTLATEEDCCSLSCTSR